MKRLNAMYANSLRDLVASINDAGIAKDDLVNIFKDNDNYIMLYYR